MPIGIRVETPGDPGVTSALEHLLARLLPRIPDALVAKLAGPPVRLRDRHLDPRLSLVTRRAASRPPFHRLSVGAARRATSEGLASLEAAPRPMARVERRAIGAADAPLRARFYHPPGVDGPRPLVLYFHQGGCVIGDLDWCETFCTILASIARCRVASVDYRLAPEHPFPAAHDDAWAAFRWACENAGDVQGDPSRIVVAGDSAGGNLAAYIALRARREGGPTPVAQVLVYPWLALRSGNDPAYDEFRGTYPLDAEGLDWFRRHLLESDHDVSDDRLSPLHVEDLKGLAPAVIATAGFDPLCDEGEAYAARLEKAGVPVTFRCFDSLSHSFTAMSGAIPAARRALEEIAWDLERLLTRPSV
jgi:acetyl esterase/lipase